MKKAKTTDIILDITENKKAKKELQRTEEWMEQRRGRWTGSQLKNLMSGAQSAGKLSWQEEQKVFLFGKTALKYIYENAMERKTGKYVDLGQGTKEMRYGTKVEPLIFKAAKKALKKKGKLKLYGFKEFPTMPNAGSSVDAVLENKKGKVIATGELKACTSWGTHYARTFELLDEKGQDFWQVQGQTVSFGVKTAFYIVAEPPQDINKYLYYDGDIMDLYKDFCKECPITIQKVKASKIHQNALLKRIAIAEQALNDWLAEGGSLKETLYKSIDFYKENPDKILKYIAPLGLKT